jgi:Zn-finger nucleic acid-binding protein
MKCPVCTKNSLDSPICEGSMTVQACTHCHGIWLPGQQYWAWVEKNGRGAPWNQPDVSIASPSDSKAGKFCPQCSRFLSRHKVGHNFDFHLDHCLSCGGTWFDSGEWEALKKHQLHDEVNFIFTETWQLRRQKLETEMAHQSRIISMVGRESFDKLNEFKSWIDAHPHKSVLYGCLIPPSLNRASPQ